MSGVEARADSARTNRDVALCEGFRMPAHDDGATYSGGRRTKTSKGRNRGNWQAVVQRALWGFERCR